MRIQNLFNNYHQPRAYRQNPNIALVSNNVSFQKLTLDEKSFKKVFPKFWTDKTAVRELKESLAQFEDRCSDDVELTALEFANSEHPEAIGSWIYCKVKSFCTGDKISDWSRFATETQKSELDGKAFQDQISVNHITCFITRLQYQLEHNL